MASAVESEMQLLYSSHCASLGRRGYYFFVSSGKPFFDSILWMLDHSSVGAAAWSGVLRPMLEILGALPLIVFL